MPELPDIEIYCDALRRRILKEPLESCRLLNPFLLRTVEPPIDELFGRRVMEVRRLGKRIVIAFEDDFFAVIHLMIAGRLRWYDQPVRSAGRIALGSFTFPSGTLVHTEAGTKKRSSLHLVRGERNLSHYDRGGLEVLDADLRAFTDRLLGENHTLKRALTDPRLFSGIGNAYSDEILHAARLSPLKLTRKMEEADIERLFTAVRETLTFWIARLREQFGEAFPGPRQITAFREGFAVHGRYNLPCPVCDAPVQRIRYAENETNYCPICQTQGRILADRSLSRLLKDDWPRSIEQLSE
jgi:formamidopyrimidine-DNA glycosylase